MADRVEVLWCSFDRCQLAMEKIGFCGRVLNHKYK